MKNTKTTKATQLLKKQHKEVDRLFKSIENSKSDSQKREAFQELASLLVAHDAIERQIFYPACEEEMGMTEDLGEALVEHGLVEFSLYQADEARGKDDFDYKCTVLKEVVEHHVEEEEDEFFPKVEKAFEPEALADLGMKMAAAFAEELQKDYRLPLHTNLNQVLRGATKTSPPKGNGNVKPSERTKWDSSPQRS